MTLQPMLYEYTCPQCSSRIVAIRAMVWCKCRTRMIREDEWRRIRYHRDKSTRKSSRHAPKT